MAADGEAITLATVEAAGTRLPTQNRWAWFDLVGEARFMEGGGGALRQLPVFLLESQGESGVGLVIGITQQLLRIGVAVEEGARGLETRLPPNQRWLAKRIPHPGPEVETGPRWDDAPPWGSGMWIGR